VLRAVRLTSCFPQLGGCTPDPASQSDLCRRRRPVAASTRLAKQDRASPRSRALRARSARFATAHVLCFRGVNESWQNKDVRDGGGPQGSASGSLLRRDEADGGGGGSGGGSRMLLAHQRDLKAQDDTTPTLAAFHMDSEHVLAALAPPPGSQKGKRSSVTTLL